MNFIVKLTYKDDKDINLKCNEDQVKRLLDCLNGQKIYWSEDGTTGFWTNLADIRYIHLLKEETKEEKSGLCRPDESTIAS